MYWFLAYSVMLPPLEMVSTAVTQVPVATFSGVDSGAELLVMMAVLEFAVNQFTYADRAELFAASVNWK